MAAVGPSSNSVEYTCHPLSIVAAMRNSPTLSLSIVHDVLHLTGSGIWANIMAVIQSIVKAVLIRITIGFIIFLNSYFATNLPIILHSCKLFCIFELRKLE
jgi:hypothetical protein